ncbi:hypothetical protein DMN96_25300, partial [Vibrio parahaemolyticus]|nr:hypothetical protein [Vibrio parahaemolyticus]
MRVTQSIPTDSLYKFQAVLGLILTIFFSISFLYIHYLYFNFSEMNRFSSSYHNAVNMLDMIDCRKEQILNPHDESKDCGKLIVTETSDYIEIEKLDYLRTIQEINISLYKKHEEIAKPLTENVNFVTGINLHLIYSVGFVISIALLVVGMRNWRDNVQKPIDQMTKLNLKFRELELRKIENEMAIVILENDKVEQELINLVLEK